MKIGYLSEVRATRAVLDESTGKVAATPDSHGVVVGTGGADGLLVFWSWSKTATGAPMDALAPWRPTDASEPGDSATGHDRAPSRYMAAGRETIDRQRDMAFVFAETLAELGAPVAVGPLVDLMFGYLCTAQMMRYHDRMGLKGDPAEDRAKFEFYAAMYRHVCVDDTPDPRSGRPGFEPYVRQPAGVPRG